MGPVHWPLGSTAAIVGVGDQLVVPTMFWIWLCQILDHVGGNWAIQIPGFADRVPTYIPVVRLTFCILLST